MKRITLFVLLSILSAATCQGETVYEWKDRNGVLHFTDDVKKVPQRYRNQARERDLGPTEPTRQQAPAPSQTQPLPTVQGKPSGDVWGGHTGIWWRNRFDTMRAQISTLQQGLTAKEARLSEVRRQHRIFQRSRDRVAANQLAAEIDRDQAQIIELRGALTALQQEAARAGVPAEWR